MRSSELLGASPLVHARVTGLIGVLMLASGLVLASVPIYMLNQLNQFAALLLAPTGQYDQVKLFLDLHRLGNLSAGILFGLWLLIRGVNVARWRRCAEGVERLAR